jgi:hypothetical protein
MRILVEDLLGGRVLARQPPAVQLHAVHVVIVVLYGDGCVVAGILVGAVIAVELLVRSLGERLLVV